MGKVHIPRRVSIAVMLFFGTFINYMVRVNLSIIIVGMVPAKDNKTDGKVQDPVFHWSEIEQAQILSAYSYGSVITSVPGGILAEKFGGSIVAGVTFLISVVLTIVSPLSANYYWAFWAVRLLMGLAGGVCFPCCHNIISKWSPPDEKGKFVASLMGGTLGTVITWPICGIAVKVLGWQWAFYVTAAFTGLITLLWFILVQDTPAKAKFISDEEKEYIEESLASVLSKRKKFPPLLKAFTSPPFIALILLHYGNMWGLQFVLLYAPKFMGQILEFDLKKSGFLSSLPNLSRFIFSFIFGAIVDVIRKKQMMSVTLIRKSFCLTSHIIPGILSIVLGFWGRDPYICVLIMTMSLGLNGSAVVTNLQNAQDLAPNYAATLYGVINFIALTSGFITPFVVAAFTVHENTVEQWKWIFLVGGVIYIVPALIFIIFGSGKVQKWNFAEPPS